jgi:hypothetical protein
MLVSGLRLGVQSAIGAAATAGANSPFAGTHDRMLHGDEVAEIAQETQRMDIRSFQQWLTATATTPAMDFAAATLVHFMTERRMNLRDAGSIGLSTLLNHIVVRGNAHVRIMNAYNHMPATRDIIDRQVMKLNLAQQALVRRSGPSQPGESAVDVELGAVDFELQPVPPAYNRNPNLTGAEGRLTHGTCARRDRKPWRGLRPGTVAGGEPGGRVRRGRVPVGPSCSVEAARAFTLALTARRSATR